MNHNHSLTARPLLCDGPTTDTSLTAMANLQSAQDIELAQIPPVQVAPERWQTAEGAKVSFIETHDRPMFDLALRFRAGSVLDGTSPGLAALVLYSLDKGTEQLDAAQFAAQMAGYSAILSRKISDDSAVITLRCLSLPTLRASAMQLLTDMLARPALRKADIGKVRKRMAFNRSNPDIPWIQLAKTTTAHVFNGHPYASSPTKDTINSISDEQIRAFHQQTYSANNLDIGLVGDLTREEAEQLINDLAQALPQGQATPAPPPAPEYQHLVRHLEAGGSATQAMLIVASRVTPRDPVFPALTLLSVILGGTYESRLTQELRTLRKLTYAIQSSLKPLDAASVLEIRWDTEPQYRDAAGALVSGLLACLRERGPSQVEFDMAVNQIAGGLHHYLANNANLAEALAIHSHQGLPADHLATFLEKLGALTPADLRKAAQEWLSPDAEVFVTLGPATTQLPLPVAPPVDQ